MTVIGLVATCAAAYATSRVGVGAMLRWTGGQRLLDVPNERSSHTRSVPRGGGLPLGLVVLAGGVLLLAAYEGGRESYALLGVAAGVALLGWLDDIYSLSAAVRLAVQTVLATAAVAVIGAPEMALLPVLGPVPFGSLGGLLAVVWIVGLVNAYNFMDGIDGIAGAQGVVAGAGWAVIGWLSGDPAAGWLGSLVAGSCAGFLAWNWAPARIFMGDVGSTFLGVILAVLAIRPGAAETGASFVGLMLVAPFVLDAGLTFLRRAVRGENVLAAHRSHLYQRMVQGGRRASSVAFMYAACAALAGSLAILWWAS
jgi:Fuc2NAc and GlcNAc transferase